MCSTSCSQNYSIVSESTCKTGVLIVKLQNNDTDTYETNNKIEGSMWILPSMNTEINEITMVFDLVSIGDYNDYRRTH